MEVVVFYAIYIGAALLFAVAAVFAVGGALHAGTRKPQGFVVYFAVVMVIVMIANTTSSGRNLMLPDAQVLMPSGASEGTGWAKWLQRGLILFLLAASFERLARFAFQPRVPGRPIGLMLTFGCCWLATVALPAAFGTRPSIEHEYLYSLIIGMAAMTTDEKGGWTAIRVCRNALLVFVCLSLLMLFVRREMVLAPYVGGLIPAFPWRYSGMAASPNAMGPLCVLLLLALRTLPFERRVLQRCAVLLVLISLFLTQSKSSWLAGLFCWGGLLALERRGQLRQALADPRRRHGIQLLLIGVGFFVAALGLVLAAGLLQSQVDRFLTTRAGGDMLTLTGRNEIWAIALDTFSRNVWFGYGPTIWDPYFRMLIGVPAAFHAHNQYINVLAASGLVGALGFAAYFIALVRRLWTRLAAYNGFALGLFLLILIRSISEVPFSLERLSNESLMHLVFLMLLAGAPEGGRSVAKPSIAGSAT
ncbi:O-antigen ligase family protein [Kinneretia asaccharophila]|uniref:O-antigen ligase n=1 Tax=Roseateles asaccharophilus TaxID=582607 RepID=A0A4R6MY51_9BURK|nr:O-antigen ligase family protein [Roseateles asaccharophilus]MDN3545616.1 O-antigen ligase family protein [Roseateles asaccharophilus]TDP07484.1 O-antigen ligase [Roseateles asaccharophilus]